jgi:hypothetical protein
MKDCSISVFLFFLFVFICDVFVSEYLLKMAGIQNGIQNAAAIDGMIDTLHTNNNGNNDPSAWSRTQAQCHAICYPIICDPGIYPCVVDPSYNTTTSTSSVAILTDKLKADELSWNGLCSSCVHEMNDNKELIS